jgi:hypothetical protein
MLAGGTQRHRLRVLEEVVEGPHLAAPGHGSGMGGQHPGRQVADSTASLVASQRVPVDGDGGMTEHGTALGTRPARSEANRARVRPSDRQGCPLRTRIAECMLAPLGRR